MECPVCMEVFQTPLLLPGCGHTICKKCAELMVTPDNYLRCPECRLVYQLRRGVSSLPKNIALERTIEDTVDPEGNPRARPLSSVYHLEKSCSDHPSEQATLYCKTCSQHICLKCYFSGTLTKGESVSSAGMHQGHKVKTSEDVFMKEKKLLEKMNRNIQDKIAKEKEYILKLQETQERLKVVLDEKIALVDKGRDKLIANIKQTSGKLKFTLKGSVVRDSESVDKALKSAKGRLDGMEALQVESLQVLNHAHTLPINVLMESRNRLKEVPSTSSNQQPIETFLSVERFNTDIEACLNDPKRALSYQTEPPRQPSIKEGECIISDTAAYIVVSYNETIRVSKLTLLYKQTLFKGMSEKEWESTSTSQLSQGLSQVCMHHLEPATMYKVKAIASNEFGESEASKEVWFRTADKNPTEIRTT